MDNTTPPNVTMDDTTPPNVTMDNTTTPNVTMDNTTTPNASLQELESLPLQGLKSDLVGEKKKDDRPRSSSAEKIKPADFPMTSVSIGPRWRRVSTQQGDMKAKIYFGRRRLIWEFIEVDGLKSKFEISWPHITAINALMPDNQPGTLQIQLSQPPLFFQRIKVEGNHIKSTWKVTYDHITKFHAFVYRRHSAIFPPGKLNKEYAKLLQCDERLFELSQKAFPSEGESPFFDRSTYINAVQRVRQAEERRLAQTQIPMNDNPSSSNSITHVDDQDMMQISDYDNDDADADY